MQLSLKGKIFLDFLLAFSKFRFSFKLSEIKMTLVTDVVLNWWTSKNMVREMSKKSRSRRPFNK